MRNIVSKNIIFSVLLQAVAILNSFLTTKITILFFGSEINGLVSSINQFLNYISLLEGGIGAVVLANLYSPIFNSNWKSVSEILDSSKKFFRQIIFIYYIYTTALSILYPAVTKCPMDVESVVLLIWILSTSLCAQYFFAISYKILLQADHKLYMCSLVQITAYVVNICLVVYASTKYENIIIVKLFSSVAFLIQPLFYTIIVKKKYQLKGYDSKNRHNLKGRWDGFFQNLAFFINNNTDIVLITIFLSLNEVSVYAVYMLVINGMKSVILSISTGFQSVLGRTLAENNSNDLESFFKRYAYIILLLSIFGYGMVIILIRQFVSVYIGTEVDYQYDRVLFPLIIALSQMVICIREPFNLLIASANKFKETNIGAAIEAILNISISLLFVQKYGLVGISIGTLIASVFRTIYFVSYLNKNIIYLNYKELLKPVILIVCYISTVIVYYFRFESFQCGGWVDFIAKSVAYAFANIAIVAIYLIILFKANSQSRSSDCH